MGTRTRGADMDNFEVEANGRDAVWRINGVNADAKFLLVRELTSAAMRRIRGDVIAIFLQIYILTDREEVYYLFSYPNPVRRLIFLGCGGRDEHAGGEFALSKITVK